MFLWMWCCNLKAMRKVLKCFHTITWMFGDLLTIKRIYRNKQEHHTMLQTDSVITNVNQCQFLRSHTPWISSSHVEHFRTFKSYVFVNVILSLEGREKIFEMFSYHDMYAWGLAYNHTYSQSSTETSCDASNIFCDHKLKPNGNF